MTKRIFTKRRTASATSEPRPSRQVQRQAIRSARKGLRHDLYESHRSAARRALLARQTTREKSGFYTGLSVAAVRQPSRETPVDKHRITKGAAFGRILFTKMLAGREVSFHATKGWRSMSLSAS